MNDQEISAFSVYSAKKLKNKKHGNVIGLKVKSKKKFKKKKRPNDYNVNSVMENLIKVTDHENSVASLEKNKKKLIKSLLKAKKESVFTNLNVTTEMDNVFLKQNGLKEDDVFVGSKSEGDGENVKKKKVKKKKIVSTLNEENNVEMEENRENKSVNENQREEIKENEVMMDVEHIKPIKPKKKKEMVKQNDKFKHPQLIYGDSVKVGEEVFSWLLSPVDIKDFFKNCWEEKPLHIQRKNKDFYKSICTLEDFKKALKQHDMYFTINIDVTSYVDGVRATENPKGKARPTIVWDLYNSGKSIRLLNPQTFIPGIRLLNTTLQEFFGCFVGANIYLTPAGTQGFAPHYDDIEAFVLQLEGEKHWKLYNPRSPEEVLPRESSRNFKEDEIGEPFMEITLQPGDLLYFPRGVIHQAHCLPHVHSLHVTVSCYQKNSWADLLEKVLPVALQKAIGEDVELRKGLPIGYLNHLGMVYSDRNTDLRQEFIKKFEELGRRVLDQCPLDAGVDQLGAGFMHDAMPPCLTQEEKLHGADRTDSENDRNFLEALTKYPDRSISVKLIRATSVRLVSEQDDMMLYYTTDNSLVYHEQEPSSVAVPLHWAQAIDYLIHSYPNFVEMKDLPVAAKVNKPAKWKRIAEFVYFLWQKGLLLFDRPLQQVHS